MWWQSPFFLLKDFKSLYGCSFHTVYHYVSYLLPICLNSWKILQQALFLRTFLKHKFSFLPLFQLFWELQELNSKSAHSSQSNYNSKISASVFNTFFNTILSLDLHITTLSFDFHLLKAAPQGIELHLKPN